MSATATTERKTLIQTTVGLRQACRLVDNDAEEAQRIYDAGIDLTPRQFAILVGVWTNCPTVVWSEHGIDIETRQVEGQGLPAYQDCYEVSRKDRVWFKNANGRMADWIEYMADGITRDICRDYAKGDYGRKGSAESASLGGVTFATAPQPERKPEPPAPRFDNKPAPTEMTKPTKTAQRANPLAAWGWEDAPHPAEMVEGVI